MKRIFILIGGGSSGKSTILKTYSHSRDIIKNGVLTRIRICSPQELIRDFCNYEKVKKKVDDIIKRTEGKARRSNVQNFNLIIPFTLQIRNGKLGKGCIIIPLKYLKKKYLVYTIHLSRVNINLHKEIDQFIKDNTNPSLTLISSKRENSMGNVNKLRRFINSK